MLQILDEIIIIESMRPLV